MKVGLIGNGAIAHFVMAGLQKRGHQIGAILLRPERVISAIGSQRGPEVGSEMGPEMASEIGLDIGLDIGLAIGSVDELPSDLDLMIDCAGHSALATYGPTILSGGTDMITLSLGALADATIQESLLEAAKAGQCRLYLASGAIGALDCLSAARTGHLTSVTYVGRKPPKSWKGSCAEDKLNLDNMGMTAQIHFEGSARQAALEYPKNANVAAAVALAGLGFDNTKVRLIADAKITHNIHEVSAEGDFGTFQFQICGQSLPDNPRSSALAAMSVLSKVDQITRSITL